MKIEKEFKKSGLMTNDEVKTVLKQFKNIDWIDFAHDKEAGTLKAKTNEGDDVFWGMQKGNKNQPWIVSYDVRLFT